MKNITNVLLVLFGVIIVTGLVVIWVTTPSKTDQGSTKQVYKPAACGLLTKRLAEKYIGSDPILQVSKIVPDTTDTSSSCVYSSKAGSDARAISLILRTEVSKEDAQKLFEASKNSLEVYTSVPNVGDSAFYVQGFNQLHVLSNNTWLVLSLSKPISGDVFDAASSLANDIIAAL